MSCFQNDNKPRLSKWFGSLNEQLYITNQLYQHLNVPNHGVIAAVVWNVYVS